MQETPGSAPYHAWRLCRHPLPCRASFCPCRRKPSALRRHQTGPDPSLIGVGLCPTDGPALPRRTRAASAVQTRSEVRVCRRQSSRVGAIRQWAAATTAPLCPAGRGGSRRDRPPQPAKRSAALRPTSPRQWPSLRAMHAAAGRAAWRSASLGSAPTPGRPPPPPPSSARSLTRGAMLPSPDRSTPSRLGCLAVESGVCARNAGAERGTTFAASSRPPCSRPTERRYRLWRGRRAARFAASAA